MRNRLIPLPLMLSATVMTSCARGPIQVAPAPTLPMPEESRVGPSPSKLLTPSEAYAEVAKLRADLERELPPRLLIRPKDPQEWIARARGQMEASGYSVERPQLLIVVDRNPRVQQMAVILAQPEGEWLVLGGSKVSTGQANRKGYYITPTGVFLHTDAILDYRAEGTFNENHIRGLGVKGMRVWDFGWQWAVKGWRSDGEGGEIRLLMHATDPDYLEQR
ncbi:MAG: L,D-transpeptidase, partial [Acetobacteraceae bacterium]|nr:L,D-transpeptidase [Acetobacteraceae bacterium]